MLGIALTLVPAQTTEPGSGIAVLYQTTSDWGTGFNGQITLRNNSNVSLREWRLEMEFDRSINTIWDARIESRNGNKYVIRGMEYNKTLEAGRFLSFGFGATPGNVASGPSGTQVTDGGTGTTTPGSTTPVPAPTRVRITLTETGRTTTAFTADLLIENATTEPAVDWQLSVRSSVRIVSATDADLQTEGEQLIFRPSATGLVREIAPRQSARLRLNGEGRLSTTAWRDCRFNNSECTLQIYTQSAPSLPPGPILLEFDEDGARTQLTVEKGTSEFRFRSEQGSYSAVSNNPAVADVFVEDGKLRIVGGNAGRAAIRITDRTAGVSRWLGVRVRNEDGSSPGMPRYLSLGAMSEDTPEHLNFWRQFEPGSRNRRVDIRYIYLNGGPTSGWDTWGSSPGSRAVNYIRNSRMLGIIPFFVFYNIPDGSESYELDLAHAQSAAYMTAYFKNLKLFLDIVRRESPDDMVGVVLEPDFLGYMAQNAGKPASEIPAATRAVYQSGLVDDSDPRFPDTLQGLVQAINYCISRNAPQVYFGWQMNLWASPAGGFTTPIPGRGIIRLTDDADIERGRAAVRREAAAITQYYLDAGIASHGASFVSIDKYGLDAVGFQSSAAADPAGSVWFWNSDHWHNYLAFVNAMRTTSGLPVILWQLPVGRINSTLAENPYTPNGRFEDLNNTNQRYEDSSPVFFLGDTFRTTGARRDYFLTNRSDDPGLKLTNENDVQWAPHMKEAAEAGVISILFGAGVGASTSSIGAPPTDGYWWISKAQEYFDKVIPVELW